MVRTESFEGYPILQMISLNETYPTCYKFFKALMGIRKTPPRLIVSDDFQNYINAAKEVFGNQIELRLCVWHIYRSWKKSVRKYEPKENWNTIMGKLINLQRALSEDLFESKIADLLSTCTDDFKNYFGKYYLPRKTAWSSIYRKQEGVNTNMLLESMHNLLKTNILNRRTNKRMDEFLQLHVEFIKSYRTKFAGKIGTSAKVKTFHKLHHESSDLEISKWSSDKCAVFKDCNITTIVQATPCCSLVCRLCDVCLHQLNCTCFDFQVKCNICQHCHHLISEMKKKGKFENTAQQNQNIFEIESEPAIDNFIEDNSERQKFDFLIQSLISCTDNLRESEQLPKINKLLEKTLSITANKTSKAKEPTQKRY